MIKKKQTKLIRKARSTLLMVISGIVLYDFLPFRSPGSYGDDILTIILAVSLVVAVTLEILLSRSKQKVE